MKEYVAPTLTVDATILKLTETGLEVLLIKRANDPFKGSWALPGGYCAAGQTTHDALKAKTLTKAGIDIDKLNYLEQLYTFDTVARDPRGHAVSVAYLGLGLNIEPTIKKTAETPQFFPLNNLPKLVFDHANIIDMAKLRLYSKSTYTNVVAALLKKEFTLATLQFAYEKILERKLDKRNFRKKFLSLNLISPTGRKTEGVAHRPANLYKFNHPVLEILTRSFE